MTAWFAVTDEKADDPFAVTGVQLERIAARGWQGSTMGAVGGWLLRAGAGFTGRANSVLPLDPPGLDFDEALRRAETFYDGHGLPLWFQIPVDAGARFDLVDAELAARGWEEFNATEVMVGAASSLLASMPGPGAAVFLDRPDDAWLRGYLYRGAVLPATAIEVLTNAENVVFASLRTTDGSVRAVARGVLSDDWLGVTAVTVDADHRRQGLGTALMAALIGWGVERGANKVYLQVDRANSAALAMYRSQGFARHHGYHYRRRPA